MILYPNKIKTNGNCHKVLKGRRNIFGHFRQSSEVFEKSSEIFGSRWISVMTRRKSHAFDLEKVGRYISVKFFLWGLSSKHNVVIYKACCFFLKVEVVNLNNLSNIEWFMLFNSQFRSSRLPVKENFLDIALQCTAASSSRSCMSM